MQNTKHNNQRERGPMQTGAHFTRTSALLVLAAVACALPARSQAQTFVTFDATTNSLNTIVQCISPAGAVAGSYYDANGEHGFVFQANAD